MCYLLFDSCNFCIFPIHSVICIQKHRLQNLTDWQNIQIKLQNIYQKRTNYKRFNLIVEQSQQHSVMSLERNSLQKWSEKRMVRRKKIILILFSKVWATREVRWHSVKENSLLLIQCRSDSALTIDSCDIEFLNLTLRVSKPVFATLSVFVYR